MFHCNHLFASGQDTPKMQLTIIIVTIFGITVSAIQVREPENETERPMPTTGPSALTATEPTDNGMAVGEAPELSPTASSQISQLNEFRKPSTSPSIDAVFPPNHKNFTGSTYLGAIESPPILDSYNKYQQQYREYYAQKNQYVPTAKPIKFEEHVSENNYVGNGLSAYGDTDKEKLPNKPLPYLFDALSTEQTAYPIPESNEFETTEAATSSPLFSFPFSGLFGGKPKPPHAKKFQEHRVEVAHKHKADPWKKIMKVITTVVPFGLFLAALTPNLLYVNTTEENRPLRLRSLDNLVEVTKTGDKDPLVELVQRFGGLEAMEDPQCEDRFFCEMSVLGQRDDSNFVEKGFWYLANETPDDIAKEAGMKEIFTAIRSKSCEIYKCATKPKKEVETKTRKMKKVPKTLT